MRYFLFLLACFLFAGCMASVPVRDSGADSRQSRFAVEIIHPEIFSSGGSVAIDPFLPGSEVEFEERLSRFSLMIVKGAAETLADRAGSFSYCDPQTADKADFIVSGRVERFSFPGKAGRFFSGDIVRIRIRAEVRNAKTGDLLARVSAVRSSSSEQRLLDFEAYDIGVSMAGIFTDEL